MKILPTDNKKILKYPQIAVEGDLTEGGTCIIESRVHGLFACFYCVLYGLFICEVEGLRPVVRLGPEHLYFDERQGPNIFDYFYQQRRKNMEGLPVIRVNNPAFFLQWWRISTKEKKLSNLLIEKYFKLKDEYRNALDDYMKRFFSGARILGVHYRGTDKSTETSLASFDEYEKKIDYLLKCKLADKFFFATDELHLRTYVSNKYKKRVLLFGLEANYEQITAGNKGGLHYQASDPFLHARDALLECYLLSRCDLLMSSHKSSMSIFATFLNPEIGHIIIEP